MFEKHQVNRHIELLTMAKVPRDPVGRNDLFKNFIANSIWKNSPAEILSRQMFVQFFPSLFAFSYRPLQPE